VQYEIWQKNASGLQSAAGRNALFITEDSTLTVPDKLAVLERACGQFQRLDFLGQHILFGGEKSFSFYRAENIGGTMTGTCPMPSLGWVDAPAEDSRISGSLGISGWVINEGLGVASVEILVNGVSAGTASYGLPRPDVVEAMAAQDDPNAPLLGFELTIAQEYLPAGRVELLVKTTSQSGEVQLFGRRMVNLQ
jgi:hypothetical protein